MPYPDPPNGDLFASPPVGESAPARYRVRHVTSYDYSEPVLLAHHRLYVLPRPVAGQICHQHTLTIEPTPATIARRDDFFGNPVTYAAIEAPHRSLLVTVGLEVEVTSPPPIDPSATPPWETIAERLRFAGVGGGLAAVAFAHRSPLIPDLEALGRFARPSFPAGRPIAVAAFDLMRRIHKGFTFDPEATTISTPLERVLERRRGVCQDFAHLLIGCLRAMGLAARYVSGFIRTLAPPGKEKLVGADATHAWVSVWCGGDDWLDLDPTNGKARDTDFVTIAWGRDYADVSPVSGILFGGSEKQVLEVAVDVERID